MKTIWIFALMMAFGLTVRATPLDEKIKAFTDALKEAAPAKAIPNGANGEAMMAERMGGMGAQLQASLATPNGEANVEAMVRQLMTMSSAEAVQTTGKAVLDELATRKKARADALTAQVDAVLVRAPDILSKAEKTQELDGLLADLQKLQGQQGGYGYDNEMQGIVNRVNQAYQFTCQWQDYLSARNSGNIQEAQNALRSLSMDRSPGDAPLVPRSEILARITELAGQVKSLVVNVPGTPPQPSGVEVAAVLNGIKTLDDIAPAVKVLRAMGPNQANDTNSLAQLGSFYAAGANGLPDSLDFNNGTMGGGTTGPEFERLKAMVFIYLLPRFIGSTALVPNPNEGVTDYLNRSMDAAEAKRDWPTLQRVIEAQVKMGRNQSSGGTRDFLAGLNQEMAGQYAFAVTSYQSALRNPDDNVSAKVVGDRLAAIKKDHEAEFEQGMKTFMNPPAPVYLSPNSPYPLRPGMPGYPYPVMAPVAAPAIVPPSPAVSPTPAAPAKTSAPGSGK